MVSLPVISVCWAEDVVRVCRWVNPLMRLATSRDISEDDVFDPHPRDDAEGVATKFEAAIERNRQSRSRWWLAKAVAQCVGFDYYTVGITKFVWCTAVVVQVVFFQKLVEFVAVGGSKATGLGYGLALGSAAFVQATMMNLLMLYSLRCGARVMAGMSVMLYRKSLRLAISSVHQASSASGASDKQTAATGSAVNLSQNDTRRVQEAITFFHFGWSALMEMAVVFGYLVVLMGSAAWLGIGIIFSLIPIQVVFARQMGRYQRGASAKTVRNNVSCVRFPTFESG
jgi:ABC-type multidrug transport system fused ATPase/permease subunit